MTITKSEERTHLIEAGKRLGRVLEELRKKVTPGVSAEELDDFAEAMIREGGDEPAFLGYTPDGASRPYPATLCVSINDEVVHGIPNEAKKIIKNGDLVSLDLGLRHKGLIVDAAITVPVGTISDEERKLLTTTKQALDNAIQAARVGAHVEAISKTIQNTFKNTGISVVKVLGGHGVGEAVHEEPFIPNAPIGDPGPTLTEGMVLALEPIANLGKGAVTLAADGYTYRTKDGSKSAHFEHTILIEKAGALVLTEA